MRIYTHKIFWFIFPVWIGLFTCCKDNSARMDVPVKLASSYFPNDTLRVVTQSGATSYFLLDGNEMGFDYELAQSLARHFGLKLSVRVAENDEEMTNMLKNGVVDLAIYNTFESKSLKKDFAFVAPQPEAYLVLVQLVNREAVSDLTDLNGKEVWVKRNSASHRRLETLNDEVGGGIIIRFASDSLNSDDLMQKVAVKEIKYTVAYRHKALLQKQFSKQLDCRIPIGFNQRNGWLVRLNNIALADSIQSWYDLPGTKRLINRLSDIYWDKNPYFAYKKIRIPKGAISPYDALFKKYSASIDWDWRLLAALTYSESEYDNTATSPAGARGLMQLMPGTAAEFGVSQDEIEDPEKSIEAGVEYIKSLNMIFRKIADKEERIKFILASYNSGPAPVLDARALAEKYGKNKDIWFDHAEFYLDKLNDPKYYKDPVVKYGSFRGKAETIRYVPMVLDIYARYLERK